MIDFLQHITLTEALLLLVVICVIVYVVRGLIGIVAAVVLTTLVLGAICIGIGLRAAWKGIKKLW